MIPSVNCTTRHALPATMFCSLPSFSRVRTCCSSLYSSLSTWSTSSRYIFGCSNRGRGSSKHIGGRRWPSLPHRGRSKDRRKTRCRLSIHNSKAHKDMDGGSSLSRLRLIPRSIRIHFSLPVGIGRGGGTRCSRSTILGIRGIGSFSRSSSK